MAGQKKRRVEFHAPSVRQPLFCTRSGLRVQCCDQLTLTADQAAAVAAYCVELLP